MMDHGWRQSERFQGRRSRRARQGAAALVTALLAALLFACGGDGAKSKQRPGLESLGPPPAKIDAHPVCVFSADCPPGQHCDLGECYQDCNQEQACAEGATCSPRARCVTAVEEDKDPPPVTVNAGTVTASPTTAPLTDRDTELQIELKSTAAEPVRYRVELAAPHLSLAEPRGSFTGSTVLKLPVSTAGLTGKEAGGTVRIHTTLGEVTVEAPIRVGLTGTYHGALSYSALGVALGSAQLAVDVLENNGDVTVRIDPERSLTFPAGTGGAITGIGLYAQSTGMDFSVSVLHDATLGGTRNHFRRPIGRELRFNLKLTDRGTLEGTFEEVVHGLFSAPITLTGTVYLEHQALQRDVTFTTAAPPTMPSGAVSSTIAVDSYFPGWLAADCYGGALQAAVTAGVSTVTPSSCALDSCADALDTEYYTPLGSSMGALPMGSDPLGGLAAECESTFSLTTATYWSQAAIRCAMIPPLAYASYTLAAMENTPANGVAAERMARILAHSLDPALLVAQDHVVKGVKSSFVSGRAGEVADLDSANAALAGPVAWALQVPMLQYLRDSVPVDPTTLPTGQTEPGRHQAARRLARALYVLSTVEEERARLSGLDRTQTEADRLAQAQGRAVLTLLEAAAVMGVVEPWADAPPLLGSELIGALTPIDQGYAALLQGPLAFGVAEGVVPFLFDPKRPQPTNFEQVLDSMASRVSQQAADEDAFLAATRAYEQNAADLQKELENLRLGVDGQIADLCGSGFDPAAVTKDADWAQCGAGGGEVGQLQLGIEQALQRLAAAQGRIKGMRDRVDIEQRRIDAVQAVRQSTIEFTDATGKQLQALAVAEGVVNAAQKAIDVGSNSNLLNAGAPAGMAVVSAAFEVERTAIAVARQDVQTAQDIQIQKANAEVEQIDSAATIQGLLVDMAQLKLEMNQDVLGVLQATLDVKNAIERAKRLHIERQRVLVRINASPLTDPTYRTLQDHYALQALRSRAEAQKGLYLAGRALEYEVNQPFGDALGQAVSNAINKASLQTLSNCLESLFADSRLALGTPQSYTTEVSVREALGLLGPITDEVSGEVLAPAEQFRRFLLQNQNVDGEGGVSIQFPSNLLPENGLWPSNVCDDKVATVEAQLVGDFLGDNDAQVELSLEGGGVLRRCDRSELVNWSAAGRAVVQAGVNTYGTATPNGSLHGLSVASALWKVLIPGKTTAPSNADLTLDKLDDIVLRVTHQALPAQTGGASLGLTCLASVGGA